MGQKTGIMGCGTLCTAHDSCFSVDFFSYETVAPIIYVCYNKSGLLRLFSGERDDVNNIES